MLETKVQSKIIKYMKSLGAHVINTTKVSPNGTADLLCCLDGRFIAIEVKRSKKEDLPDIQTYQIKKVRNAGGISFYAHSVDCVKFNLDYYL